MHEHRQTDVHVHGHAALAIVVKLAHAYLSFADCSVMTCMFDYFMSMQTVTKEQAKTLSHRLAGEGSDDPKDMGFCCPAGQSPHPYVVRRICSDDESLAAILCAAVSTEDAARQGLLSLKCIVCFSG